VLSKSETINAITLSEFLPQPHVNKMPMLTGNTPVGEFANEREILYKVLFDMKSDLHDLKKLTLELLKNGASKVQETNQHLIQKIYGTKENDSEIEYEEQEELALIPIYFIALIWGNGDADERKKAVVKFFIYTLAGSLFMLVGFAYLYQKAGSLLIEDLYELNLSGAEQVWLFVGFFLAYAIKIPIIPFHTWQANVYQKAPTVGTMLLSGIMLKMGLYSVIRWQLPIVPWAAKGHVTIMLVLGIAGVIYGSIVALRQKDLKKLKTLI
jgi:hypothetical protein